MEDVDTGHTCFGHATFKRVFGINKMAVKGWRGLERLGSREVETEPASASAPEGWTINAATPSGYGGLLSLGEYWPQQ